MAYNAVSTLIQYHLETNRHLGKPRVLIRASPVVHDFEISLKELCFAETVAGRKVLIAITLLVDPDLLIRRGTWDGRVDHSGILVWSNVQFALFAVLELEWSGGATGAETDVDVIFEVGVVWEGDEVDHMTEA